MKISVLIPVFNTSNEHLAQALDSVLAQTFEDFELIILNDNPKDIKNEKLILSYKDSRIKYFKNEKNMGISNARNKLVSLARGEYLAICDHDDISRPSRFKKQVEALDKNQEIGVVSGQYRQFGAKEFTSAHPLEDFEIKETLLCYCAIAHPCAMIRKSIMLPYENEFSPAEDYMLFARLMDKTKFQNLPDVLLDYRLHKNNTTKKQRKLMDKCTVEIHAYLYKKFPKLYEGAKQKFKEVNCIKFTLKPPFISHYTKLKEK